MPVERPFTITPLNVRDLAGALSDAWLTLYMEHEPHFEQPCTRGSILVLLAHWHLETAGGTRCINWNIGNVKSVVGDGYDFTWLDTFEFTSGLAAKVRSRFRAFETLAEGAHDYLRTLARHFTSAWPAVLEGDPRRFAELLHEAHYYTAPVDAYASGLVARYRLVNQAWPEEPIVAANDQPVFKAPDPEET